MVLETAVVGGGTVSETHLAGVQRLPETALVAVCDHDESRARETAKAYDVNAYADFEAMLAMEDLDWIHLCTPVQTHLDLAKMALEDGVPIQIERPVTATAREARELQRLAAEHGTAVSVVHSHTFDPAVRRAAAMVDDGAVGTVRSVELHYTIDSRAEPIDRVSQVSALPGGAVEARLPDPVSVVLRLGGYPVDAEAIQAAATHTQADSGSADYDGVTFQYTSDRGVLCGGTVHTGTVPGRTVTVSGDAGRLRVDLVSQTVTLVDRDYTSSWVTRALKNVDHALSRVRGSLEYARDQAMQAIDGNRENDPYYQQFERDARAIRRDDALAVPVEEGVWTLEIMEAVRAAAAAQGEDAPIEVGSDAA